MACAEGSGEGLGRERVVFSIEAGPEDSSSEPGTLEDNLERERPIPRGGYTKVPCFAVNSSPRLSSVAALFIAIRSRAGDDDNDGGSEFGGLGVVGWGIWKAGGRRVSCGEVASSSKRRRRDDGSGVD